MKKYYPLEGPRCWNRLTGRTAQAVASRVGLLKLTYGHSNRWTDKEKAILKKYFPREGGGCAARFKEQDSHVRLG